MNIKIQSVRFDADKKLIDFIENKVGKLSKFAEDILGTEVILKLDNSENNENKIVEIKLEIPHSSEIFAKRQSKTFEKAVSLSIEAIENQLKKFKEKQRT